MRKGIPLKVFGAFLACAAFLLLACGSVFAADNMTVTITKPLQGVTVTDNGATGTINIALPYGTEYQMLHATVPAGSTFGVYQSNGTTAINPLTAPYANAGDYKLGSGGTTTWTGGTFHLIVKNGTNSRNYTITCTVSQTPNYPTVTGDKLSPLNIRGGEYAGDVLGASPIGYGGSVGLTVEGPMTPSSYSGLNWYDSYYGVSGGYNVQPVDPAGVPQPSWNGDNMYLQTISKDGVTDGGKLSNYGIQNSPGLDKLSSDILRYHEFKPDDSGAPAVYRDDGDRGATASDRQRLEIKSRVPGNNEANAFGGDVMTYHWDFLLPSEFLRYQTAVNGYKAGDFINTRGFLHIFQIKEDVGPLAAQPVCTLTVAANQTIEFRNYPMNGGTGMHVVCTLPYSAACDRWIDATVTFNVGDASHIYVVFKDLATGAVIKSGSWTGNTYRRPENSDGTPTDQPVLAGQVDRCKWGIYRALYSMTSSYYSEFQSASDYISDVYVVKHDPAYVFPDGYSNATATRNIVAWTRYTGLSTTAGNMPNLPAADNIVLSTGDTVSAGVTWDTSTFNPNLNGLQTIYGTFTGSSFDTNTKNIRPSIDVTVSGGYSNSITLDNITVDGVSVSGFSGTAYAYSVAMPATQVMMPVVRGVTSDSGASVTVDYPAAGYTGGPVVVTVSKPGYASSQYSITLTSAANIILVNGLSLDSGDTMTLNAGETEQIIATVLPENATNAKVAWSSSDPGVVSVDQQGRVTGKALGSAVITAGVGSLVKTCSIAVTSNVMYTVTFDTNGGAPADPVQVPEYGTVGAMPDTAKAGYMLAGWLAPDNTAFTAGTPVTGDITGDGPMGQSLDRYLRRGRRLPGARPPDRGGGRRGRDTPQPVQNRLYAGRLDAGPRQPQRALRPV